MLSGFELQAADVGLNTFRTLLKSGKMYSCPMPFDPLTRTLYVTRGSILALQIDSNEQRLVLEPPNVPSPEPPPPDDDEDDEDDEDEERDRDRAPYFGWFTRLSPDGREIVALADCHHHRVFLLVRADIETGAAAHRPMSGFGYLDLDFASRRVYQGDHPDGPEVATIEGARIGVLRELRGIQMYGTLSPGGGKVLLWDTPLAKVPFALWNLERGTYRELKDFGNHPTWSPDGKSFWFMKGNHELWRYDLDTDKSEPFIQVKGMAWDYGSVRAWYLAPVLSPDGRFMYVSLTEMTKATHVACVVDTKERIVRQIPDRHHDHVTWLGSVGISR